MSDFSRFRSAFNGFSRTDVVNYIEETSAAHQKEIEQLEGEKQQLMQENDHLLAENARLTTELADLKAAQEKLKEEDSALSQQIVTLSQEASELAERAQRAQKELEDLKAAQAEPAQETQESTPAEPEMPDGEPEADAENLQTQELAAYRRAEQAERNAMARARKLREQLNLLCEQSKDRYLDAGEEISALSSDLSAGLTRLSETLADIQVIFDDAENAFDELQLPEEE